jgi:hypothetical protein
MSQHLILISTLCIGFPPPLIGLSELKSADHSPLLIAKFFTRTKYLSFPFSFPLSPLLSSPISQPIKMRPSTLAQFILPSAILASTPYAPLGSTLNVTVLGARHNRSTLECWALNSGFETSDQAGIAGSSILDLGTIGGNASFTALPAGFDGGRHNAPALL